MSRAPLVFVTGGLGPTSDDITRDAVADALGCSLGLDPQAEAHLRAWFARNNRPVNSSSIRQALVLEGATVLPNRAGIAPGQRIITPDGCTLYLLPGPPRELRAILEDHVLPDLRTRFAQAAPLVESISMFAGLGESDLQAWMNRQSLTASVEVGYCASPGILEFRLTTHDESARPELESLADAARREFSGWLYATRRAGIEEVLAERLSMASGTMSVAESCTGGLIGSTLTSVPGSSAWFLGGVICYSNDSKVRDLHVSPELLSTHGAVSEPCAREMAEGVRNLFRSTYAVATTGIAGPGGGTPDKPVGTAFIAIAGPEGTKVSRHLLNGDRETIRASTRQRALSLLLRLMG
jgi:nicotinamide-nucleotide amidase